MSEDLIKKEAGCERQSLCKSAQDSKSETAYTAADSNWDDARLKGRFQARLTQIAHDELQPQV